MILGTAIVTILIASLSARRAWIEIAIWGKHETILRRVALRKESVDRNEELA